MMVDLTWWTMVDDGGPYMVDLTWWMMVDDSG